MIALNGNARTVQANKHTQNCKHINSNKDIHAKAPANTQVQTKT